MKPSLLHSATPAFLASTDATAGCHVANFHPDLPVDCSAFWKLLRFHQLQGLQGGGATNAKSV